VAAAITATMPASSEQNEAESIGCFSRRGL